MKIAVASDGKKTDSQISSKGGRAPYYLVFEGKNLVETIKNPFIMGSGGAGFSVAHMLAEKGVKLVIAGKLGGNMIQALSEKGIGIREETDKSVESII